MKKIYKLIKTKNIDIIADEIIDAFVNEANSDNVDYQFTIQKQTGKVSEKKANTFFHFDTKPKTVLEKLKKALFDEELKDIEEGSNEEEKLMTDVNKFLRKISDRISNKYHITLKEVIKKVVLGGKSDESIPLNTIQILFIDIADYSSIPESNKYLLKIGKNPGSTIKTDEIIIFIQNREEETEYDIDTILMIERQAGNPLFKNITGIIKGEKFLNDINLMLFVDYSLAEELDEKLIDSEKE